jgi:hypothetical protein
MRRRPAPRWPEPREHAPSCPRAQLERVQAADRHLYFCTCWWDPANASAADLHRLRETLDYASRLAGD